MRSIVILFIFLQFLHLSLCEFTGEEIYEDCDDFIVLSDENGTTFFEDFSTTSVNFYLLTPDNQTIPLNSSNLHLVNTSQPTKLLVHGLGEYQTHVWVDQMAYVFHTKTNSNIIAVDWSKISTQEKTFVVSQIDNLGKIVGNFILKITEADVEHLEDVHLIGSSVGAQVSGAAGEKVGEKGKKVGRITGLDPTVPENLEVLDEEDAEFVDVIHTSVAVGERKVGKVDFYLTADHPDKPICFNDSCVDLLADDFYILTIDEGSRFEGVSCYNFSSLEKLCDKAHKTIMGEHVPRNASGSFLVATDGAFTVLAQEKFVFLSSFLALMVWYFLN